MKKTRIVLVGALVLALAFVMGCKAASSGTSGDWDPNTDSQKTWRKSNSDANTTVRSFEGFGALNINSGAVVKIEISNPKASKAAVLFDYKKYNKEGTTVSYYQLGIGTKGYDGKTPEFYLTKVTDIKPDEITASTTSESASGGKGNTVDIQNNISFAEAVSGSGSGNNVDANTMYTLDQNGKLTTYVGFIKDGDSIKVRIGMYEEGKGGWKAGSYLEKDLTVGAGWSGEKVTGINGQLCAYGMLKKATGGQVSTENTYTLINKTGKMAE